MLPTATPSYDTLTQLQFTVQDLQNAEQENQKLWADFATYSESIIQALQNSNQETQVLWADFVAYSETTARCLAQATEQINELDHMVLNLLKTTDSLSSDYQQLHCDFVDQAKEVDGRLSSTETVTTQITTTLANTVKTFASLQTCVNDFQIQLNATTETQISDKCEQAVTAVIAQLLDKFNFATNKRT